MPSSNPAPQHEELRRKLIWLTVFRTVAISLLMAIIAGRLLSSPGRELSQEDAAAFTLMGAVYLLTLVYGLILRARRVGVLAAHVQILGDIVLASCLVYVTGGPDSPFTFTYSIAVLAASILLFERGALVAAAMSTVAYTAVVLAIQLKLLHPPTGTEELSATRLSFLLFSHTLSQLLIAILAGYLTRQLWMTGGHLRETRADLDKVSTLQRQIVDCMPSGLLTCDASGHISFVNPAAQAILGLEEGKGPGQKLEELLPGAQGLGPHARRRELRVPTPAGPRMLGLTVTPLEGPDGSSLIVFQDLTDLRRMESALQRADALASLGKLSAQLAHEIRNPLAAMRGSAQMLAQDLQGNPSSERLSAILLRESDRLTRLVEDFLRFARPPAPARKSLDVAALVSETVEMLRVDPLASSVDIALELQPLTLEADADQLRQVLLNLLRNALQAVAGAGKVRVGISRGPQEARVSVWDSAGSIASADLARIFEPFVTTRSGGTGLGLSTAHAIVQAHGGTIEVMSSPQAGTEFIVTLPLRTSEVLRAHPGR